ncbi:major facilitator superfamily domain-containing protein [Aspergillus spectabilis]
MHGRPPINCKTIPSLALDGSTARTHFSSTFGAQAGPIFDCYGPAYVVIPGSVGMVASILFFSFSTEYYQIFFSFSVLGGLSACTLFNPAIAVIGHWFDRRRGLATGVACTAGGLGGAVFPLIVMFAGPRIGFGWAIRIIALISAVLLAAACSLLRTRLLRPKGKSAAVDFRALRDVKYATTTAAVFLVEFAVFIPITYISSYALHVGNGPVAKNPRCGLSRSGHYFVLAPVQLIALIRCHSSALVWRLCLRLNPTMIRRLK